MSRGRAWAIFGLFAFVTVILIVLLARSRPFWHDEIDTILGTRLPDLGTFWRASLDGFDFMPPLNSWLTRVVHHTFGVGHVSTRLPAMAGYLTMIAVVFAMLRARTNVTTALSGVAIAFPTTGFEYAYEARGYGLMLGLFAIALLAWSQAARGIRRAWNLPLLTVALAAGIWNHYYAVFAILPIAAADVVRWRQNARADRGVIVAVGAALLACLPLAPLARAAGAQESVFWSYAAPKDLITTYAEMVWPMVNWPFAAAAAAIGALMFLTREGTRQAVPSYEVTAGIATLLIPVAGVAFAMVTRSAFVHRYLLMTIVGICLVVPAFVWAWPTRRQIAERLLCAFLLLNFAQAAVRTIGWPLPFPDPYASNPILQQALKDEGPLVVASSLEFAQYWYYTPAPLRSKLVYLTDAPSARRIMLFDTIDRGYLAMARWTDFPQVPYEAFVASHREFRVYENGEGWLIRRLDEIGAERTEIAGASVEHLYLVRMK